MVAEIITVATEVVNANVSNNVAPYITEGLRDIGFDVFYQSSVDNDDSRVKKLFNVAASRSDLIALVTGYGVKADNIMVVKGGIIAEQGTHEELIAAGGIYKDLYETQFRKVLDYEGEKAK